MTENPPIHGPQMAPYAASDQATRGRAYAEPTPEYRGEFQRDRDRVLYSRAFRRLHDKSQLYLAEAEEQHRNRLTHTLEVAQVARTLARALRLNEDLVETVALAHDLGRTPFGRSGERALEDLLRTVDGEGPPPDEPPPGFLPNQQALRVVDLLEDLSLTDTIEGAGGVYRANVVVPEPAAILMLAFVGVFGLLASTLRFRRSPCV